MEIGFCFKRKDGLQISEENENVVGRVRTFILNEDNSYLINDKYLFKEEELEEISLEEFIAKKIKSKRKIAEEIIRIDNPIKVGDFIRKVSWNLFIDNRPTIKVKLMNYHNCWFGNQIRINNIIYDINSLIILSEEETQKLNEEYNNLSISDSLPEKEKITACIRESTGTNKIKYVSPKTVLQHLWVIKKKNPNLPYEAYKCYHCNNYHIGKRN